jgi:putative membrane-bound dehydrogenase-like protein
MVGLPDLPKSVLGDDMKRAPQVMGLALLLAALAIAAEQGGKPEPPEGVLPVGADGKPLNFDFETGTLKDWTAEGEAFVGQPIKGDTVSPRRNDMKSQHQGDYWIGTYERAGDKPQGTLTSVPFKVTHPWASFLVGGGAHPTTAVELVRKDTGEVFSRTSGFEEENLRRVAVDLRPLAGKEIFIRLVDKHSGHWGHINFDDFRFHSTKPSIPEKQVGVPPPPPDVYKFAGIPPEKAAKVMTVPEGFEVKLFAGEPDVRQPIAMTLDDRGRIWVAEAYCYPVRRKDKEANDRILIFEDTDGDGHFDKRTVFMEGLNLVSGLEVGFGGVWIGAAPYLMFVPIKPGEDKPAGPPQILLDGWHYEDTHETLNTFSWGPDGWLYGCQGVFTHSLVGKPGTPDKQRTPINAGVWRYHPLKHVFEVFAEGTSNPWGLDFNDYGQAFIEACVIPHCFHMIQGGRFLRQAGNHFNPYTYADIQPIVDHLHWQGANPWAGNNRSDTTGGGHAHAGLLCYLGGAWPAAYRDQLLMGNIHGRRLNMDIPKAKGSGYVATHGPDFLLANDAWARFLNMRSGPDGNVYLIDWYDQQACHRHEPEVWDRSNGRIYKICYRGTKPVQVDLSAKTDQELVDLQLNENDWYVRHARRILQERSVLPTAGAKPYDALAAIAFGPREEPRRLRALWALHVAGGLHEQHILRGLEDAGPHFRGWCMQLALEGRSTTPAIVKKLTELARTDPSPVVRLYLASAAQRLPLAQRWDIVQGLLAHGEDANDHNLPLMYWYAAEPLATVDQARALDLAEKAKVPLLAFMVRRLGAAADAATVALIVDHLKKSEEASYQRTVLGALLETFKGRRKVQMPSNWSALYDRLRSSSDSEVGNAALALAVKFGDVKAFAEVRGLVADAKADSGKRLSGLVSLLDAQDKELAPVLHQLIADADLRSQALRGLAAYDHPQTPGVILKAYAGLNAADKRDAINTLASRAVYAKALLDAVGDKSVPASDVPADLVRQLRNLKNKELDKKIAEVWGVVRSTPADKAREMERYRKMLTSSYQPPRDVSLGRALFAKTCQQCHTLYGVGGKVGPDITGSNRGNLDYLLENILDPSAVIPKEYAATVLELKNGRVVTGIVREQTPAAVTVVTATETLTIPRSEIDSLTPSNVSMMPDDQLKPFSDHEVRALIAYLQSPGQVPLLATADTVKDFFNGKDLAGWDGDPKLWSVENGEIVGHSPGIPKNEFLKSLMVADDFRLTVKVKLVPNRENSGIQFRSEPLPDGEVRGYQADVGAGWWGKLYEERGREILSSKSGEPFVKVDEWNEYEVIAIDNHIKTFLNGHACVDLNDPPGARRGIFAFQIHSGGPMEVRFKDLKLEVMAAGKKEIRPQAAQR